MRTQRVVYILIILGFLSVHNVAHAQETPPIPYAASPDKPENPEGGKMKSRKLHSGDSKKKDSKKLGSDDQEDDALADLPVAGKSKNPEDEVWRKYKKISGKAKDEKISEEVEKAQAPKSKEKQRVLNDESSLGTAKKDSDAESDKDEDEDKTEENTQETAAAEDKKADTGIAGILDGYIERTTNSPKIGQRSFRNPEDKAKKAEKENSDETKEQEDAQ